MKILITGSQGMIGSHLKEYLKEWFEIVEFEGDVTNKSDWNNYPEQYYALIHLAALAGVRQSIKEPEVFYENNVDGTRLALQWGKRNAQKIIYASSSNAAEWWTNPYAVTKKINEIQAENHAAIGMRFHTVWPGREDMLYQMLKKGEVKYVNVNHTRDFIHVKDLCKAIHKIVDNFHIIRDTVGSIVDIGTGHGTSVKTLAEKHSFKGQWKTENPAGERVHTRAEVEWLYNLGWAPEHNILNS